MMFRVTNYLPGRPQNSIPLLYGKLEGSDPIIYISSIMKLKNFYQNKMFINFKANLELNLYMINFPTSDSTGSREKKNVSNKSDLLLFFIGVWWKS